MAPAMTIPEVPLLLHHDDLRVFVLVFESIFRMFVAPVMVMDTRYACPESTGYSRCDPLICGHRRADFQLRVGGLLASA